MNYLQNNDANNLHFAEFFFIFLFVSHSIYPILVPPLLLTLQIHWNILINNIQRIRLIFSSSNEPCLFQLVPPQSYKQPLSHGVLEAYNSLDKAQNRKLNRQDNRSWISFAVQKSQVFLFPTFAFFFLQISMNVSIFLRLFSETAVAYYIFLVIFIYKLVKRYLSKIDPLRSPS